ncbi:hypothetical protein KCM76_00920 [Zooshikella marina]|uniref:hypothetical protein n=1 Tax=Zooshikella ganghwensis TaxID=202772 RepID=UPI0004818675|nr:hypothetical protein [Zooshikella ganghwensis]MBU2704523.1 hypothetical protein [Zooshikella ganghwensis]
MTKSVSTSVTSIYPWNYALQLWHSRQQPTRPVIGMSWYNQPVSATQLREYLTCCGLDVVEAFRAAEWSGYFENQLPPLFPLVMSFPLHTQLLLSDHASQLAVWLRIVSCQVRVNQALSPQHSFDFSIHYYASDSEFPWVRILGYQLEQLVWECELAFSSSSKEVFPKEVVEQRQALLGQATQSVESSYNVGRWYLHTTQAKAFSQLVRDFHPAHLSNVMAKCLGYQRATVNAVWLLSAALSYLPLPRYPIQIQSYFPSPAYVDSVVELKATQGPQGHDFRIVSAMTPRLALGQLVALH